MRDLTTEELAAAQVSFDLVATLVHEEPTGNLLESLREPGALDEAPFGNDNENVRRGLTLMRSWLADNQGEPARSLLAREWLDLLVGEGQPKAPCWESFYTEPDRRLFAENSVDIKRAFREHGAQLQTKENEPVDHLGILLRFVAFLMGREATALESGDTQSAAWYASSQEEFLSSHVLPWLSAWFANVQRGSNCGFYLGVASLLFGIVQSYVERFSIYYHSSHDAFEEHEG